MAMLGFFVTVAAGEDKPVRYVELKNYFHNNNAPIPSSPTIKTKAEFERQFGMAARMGADGQPTPVDWKRQVVLAIVLPETNVETTIDSVGLFLTGAGRLSLRYLVRQGKERGYTTQHIYLMAVGKKWKDAAVSMRQTVRRNARLMPPTYTFVSNADTARHITFTLDYPLSGPKAMVDSVRTWIEGQLRGLVATFNDGTTPGEFYPYNQNDAGQLAAFYGGLVGRRADMLNTELQAAQSQARCAADIHVRKVDETADYVSFEATGYTFLGGAHGLSFIHGRTFSKADGHALRLVKDGEALRKQVTERLRATNKDYVRDGETVSMPANAPYVKDGKVVFQYQPYEIGAYAIGAPSCTFWPAELVSFEL